MWLVSLCFFLLFFSTPFFLIACQFISLMRLFMWSFTYHFLPTKECGCYGKVEACCCILKTLFCCIFKSRVVLQSVFSSNFHLSSRPLTEEIRLFQFYLSLNEYFRSSHQKCSEKKGDSNFAKFAGKRLCQRLIFNKVAGLRHNV